MDIKKVLGVAGLVFVGYKVGKLRGEIKMIKIAIDIADEIMPGFKRQMAESVSEAVIDEVFGDSHDKKKEES